MSAPRRARAVWHANRGWVVLFPNDAALWMPDYVTIYVGGTVAMFHPWDEAKFDGQIIEWIDEPAEP